jgi:hypothetical protein
VGGDTPDSARHLVAALRDLGVLCGAAMLLVYVGLELGVGNWGFSYLPLVLRQPHIARALHPHRRPVTAAQLA